MRKLKFINERVVHGNFLNEKIKLGNIYSVSDKEIALLDNIGNYANIDLEEEKYSSVSNGQDFVNSTSSDFKISFKGEADAHLLKGECGIEFKKSKSTFFSLKGLETKTLKLGQIKKHYIEYLHGNGLYTSKKFIVIVNVVYEAQSGTLIHSESKDTKVELKANNNQPLTSAGIIGKGNIEIVVGKNKVVTINQSNKFQPLYNAVWWRPRKEKWDEL